MKFGSLAIDESFSASQENKNWFKRYHIISQVTNSEESWSADERALKYISHRIKITYYNMKITIKNLKLWQS